MIKMLAFDLDGVCVDLCTSHKKSLDKAIVETVGKKFTISESEHTLIYNGLPTRKKLEMLTKYKGLPQKSHEPIERLKQQMTIECINNELSESLDLIQTFKNLKVSGYITACVSNSIPETIDAALYKIGIRNYMDFIVSNKTTIHNKPSPAMYLHACARANVSPWQALVFEDSPVGMRSCISAGCNLCVVRKPSELTESFIRENIELYN